MIFDSNSKSIEQKLIVEYMEENELIFITVLDKIFSRNPNIHLYPFFKDNRVDSLITSSGYGMIHLIIKDQYIDLAVEFLNGLNVFSIYGNMSIVDTINKKNNKKLSSECEYYVMKLTKDNFTPFTFNEFTFNEEEKEKQEEYVCLKCDSSHFKYLKKLQYLYHKEEVYRDEKNYPYYLEMSHFKRLLNNRLNYAIFKNLNNPKAVAKCNVNASSKDCYQIGGVFTLKDYRNKNIATYCVSKLMKEIFKENSKNRVVLYVKKDNIGAIRVYEKLGFKRELETKLLYFN